MDLKYCVGVDLVSSLLNIQLVRRKKREETWLPVAKTEPGFNLVYCESMKYLTSVKLVKYFWLYSA